ncbi:Lysophospholipid acyltransferase [hydrothermal vent metagenome]|uniref:Lysophospholipid acyltransferase n=1 Tax=hydrothermal vent metagenome TaxID=652676 RepID=A0A3B1CEF8_9ZZZZ
MKGNRQKDWLNQPERGTKFSLQLIAWIAGRIGRPAGRVLLYPISLYFLLFSGAMRGHSRNYLARVIGKRATLRDVYKHYHTFAGTILDRVFTLTGRLDLLEIEMFGVDALLSCIDRGRGCFLLGSHLGSFEIIRAVGADKTKTPISILMYEDNARKISEALKSINPGIAQNIINTARPDALLIAKERIEKGEIVGILGDRKVRSEKVVNCEFLGSQATFPQAPMMLAALTTAPVFLFFGLYKGGNRYEIHLELFSERVQVDKNNRRKDLEKLVQRYASRLEFYCRKEPYNWFNFYDFWK